MLPIAHVERINKMDGVTAATPFSWFGGSYKSQQNLFAQFGVEPKSVFDVFNEYEIAEDQLAAFKNDKQGCVADKGLAEQMEMGNWRANTVGRHDLSIRSRPAIGRGFRSSRRTQVRCGSTGTIWTRNSKRWGTFAGNAGMIYAKCKVSDEVAIVSEEIDAKFANSENATRTRTEAAFQRMFADMLGDVQTYIRYISLAVVFALALVAATAMAMSMRERTTEVAVLKAIGFSKQRVLALVLGESTMIAILGGLLGIAGGLGALQMLSSVPIAAQLFPIPVSALAGLWLVGLVVVAAAIGFVSGLVPAVLAAQLSVVNGLRRVV